MKTVLPGGTLGILGGGQLGRMIAIEARRLGYGVVVLAPEGDAPAAGVADHTFRASFEDTDAVRVMAAWCDVITYEFENVPATTLLGVADRVFPSVALLGITQDRIAEHQFLHQHHIPTAPGQAVYTLAEAATALGTLGAPARLKCARGGYDGGGQWRIRTASDLGNVPPKSGPWLLEAEVAFEREISVVVCRGADGRPLPFPVFENRHQDGILLTTVVPAAISPAVEREAIAIATTLAEAADLRGTLTVEMFETAGGVRVNELAPRVHNSGHLTLEATAVSQFEQHLRAVTGLPLLAPRLRRPAAMGNLLGQKDMKNARLLGVEGILGDPDVHLHLYGKRNVRPRRKMGHITVTGDDRAEVLKKVEAAVAAVQFG